MEINYTLNNLEAALSSLEYHTDNLKNAIAIAKLIKSKYDGENLSFAEEEFSSDTGYAARRFNNTFEYHGDFEADYLFKILNAVEEYEKGKRDNVN